MSVTTVLGSNGNDSIIPAAGDSAGAQYYYTGGATPNITNAANGGSDTITTGGGNDTVWFGLNNGHDKITLGSGNDSVIAAGETGPISGGSHDTVNAGTGNSTIDFQTGGHALYNGNTVAGSSGADSVYAYGDTLGFDTFIAGINSDTIIGSQAGNDSVVIGSKYHGNYYIDASGTINDGGTGDDVIVVGAGDANVSNSTVSGGSFHDQIITYQHTHNVIDTNAGSDTVNTLAAEDTITTNGGNNLVYSGTGGNEVMNFHGGTNTISYVYAASPVDANLATGTATVGANSDSFTFSGVTTAQNIALSNNFNDTVTGIGTSTMGFQISTGSGNDELAFTTPGSTAHGDTLFAGAGQDTLDFSGVTSAVNVNDSASTIVTAAPGTWDRRCRLSS